MPRILERILNLKQSRWWIYVAFILFLVSQGVSGIIGNQAYAIFEERVLPFLQKNTTFSVEIWQLFLLVLTTIGFVSILIKLYMEKLSLLRDSQQASRDAQQVSRDAQQELDKLNKFDEKFFRFLPCSLQTLPNSEEAWRGMQFYLDEILRFWGGRLPNYSDCHILIYRPNSPQNPKFLEYWHGRYAADEEKNITFPVDKIQPNEKRGIQGSIFIDDNLKAFRVARLSKNSEGQWESTDDDYKFYDSEEVRPPHQAIAAICLADKDGRKIGILCFASRNESAFSSDEEKEIVKELLEIVSLRLSAAIQISESKNRNTPM